MTSVDSNFNFLCGRSHGAGPPPPVYMRPPEPDPLRVDAINEWPLIQILLLLSIDFVRTLFTIFKSFIRNGSRYCYFVTCSPETWTMEGCIEVIFICNHVHLHT